MDAGPPRGRLRSPRRSCSRALAARAQDQRVAEQPFPTYDTYSVATLTSSRGTRRTRGGRTDGSAPSRARAASPKRSPPTRRLPRRPDNLEARWKLLRGPTTSRASTRASTPSRASRSSRRRAESADDAIAILARRAGRARGTRSHRSRSGRRGPRRSSKDPDAAPTFFWSAVCLGAVGARGRQAPGGDRRGGASASATTARRSSTSTRSSRRAAATGCSDGSTTRRPRFRS